MSFFGEKISQELTNQVFSKLGLTLKFDKIEIGLFPPTSYFKKVEVISREGTSFKLSVVASSLGIQFSYLDLFSKQFTINQISISDAAMKLETPKGEIKKDFNIKDLNKIDFKEIFGFYKENVYNKLPIRIKNLELENIDLEIDSKKFFVDQFLLGIYPNKVSIMGTVENENLVIFSALYPGEQEIDFDFEVNDAGAKIKKVKFKNRQDYVGIKGNITNKQNSLEMDGELDFFIRMETLARAFPQFGGLKEMEGIISGRTIISNSILNPDLAYKLSILDFSSKYINLDQIELEGEKKGHRFLIKNLMGNEGKSTIRIKNPIEFVDIAKVDLKELRIPFEVNDFYSNKIIKYVPALDPIKGYLSGDFDIQILDKNLYFILKDNFSARDFKLQFSELSKPLLENDLIKLSDFKVSVIKNDNILVEGNLIIKKSKLSVQGKILNKENYLEFIAKSDPIFDFRDLGPISGIDIKGSGQLNLKVSGPEDDVRLIFDSQMDDFGFLGFNLGNVTGQVEYNIKKKKLSVFKLNSVQNNSEIIANGELIFGENSNIDFHILTPHITYQDSLLIYEPLVKDVSWLKQKDDFEYLADYKVTGPMDPKKLSVKGYFKGGESFFLGEEVNSFEGKYSYQNQKLQISNFTVNDGKGKIFFNANYEIPSSDFDYNAEIEGLRLTDIEFINNLNLGINGELVGTSKGGRKEGLIKTSSTLNLLSTKIGPEEVKESNLELITEGKRVNISGNLIGDYFKINSYLDLLPSKKSKNSFVDLKIQAERLPLLLGIISSHNIINQNLEGELYASLNSSFDFLNPELLNAEFKIQSFNFKSDGLEMDLKSGKNSISIKNGKIENWNLDLSGLKDQFSSKGEGNFSSSYKITNDFNLNSQIFQLLTPNIAQISGITKGNIVLAGNFPKFDYSLALESNLDRLKLQNIPGVFEDFKIDISQQKSLLSINKFKGKYGNGEVNVRGNIKFGPPEPQVNLDYDLASINYPLFKKSVINFSGKGSLHGISKPYNLNGDFLLGYGDILDSPADLMKGQGGGLDYSKWLPKKRYEKEGSLFNLNLKIDLANRLSIKNKMAELKFGGQLEISGNNENKYFTGNFSAIPGLSKFNFKGNNFLLSEGIIEVQNYPRELPYLRLSASSTIKKYDVKINASGKINKMVFDLTSEPSLSREDILSLITLGFTSKDALGLNQEEKQTMTSVGVGSLLADQLELSEGLTSDFGVRLNVSSELQETQKTNLPETREGSVLPTQSKFKSATRIGFKKQITEKSEISFSNTFGGSIDQKQEVSGEYYLNKNTSLRGTYEMFNSSQREIQDSGAISNNLGVDLIFKWSFK